MGVAQWRDVLYSTIRLKWMLWGYPYFRKPPNILIYIYICIYNVNIYCIYIYILLIPFVTFHTGFWAEITNKTLSGQDMELCQLHRSEMDIEDPAVCLRRGAVPWAAWACFMQKDLLVLNVGNGWEWGNGIIINGCYGSFPHSLLRTRKKIMKDLYVLYWQKGEKQREHG